MTCHRSKVFTVVIALGISSCAQPARETPAKKTAAPAAARKPVRMNGRGKISSVSLTDLFALQQSGKVLLYDARPGFYYHLGHIPGAISLPKANCDPQIAAREAEIKAALAAKKTVVVYCTNTACPDSRTVAIHLAGFGYPCGTLQGGWESWKESGLPTE